MINEIDDGLRQTLLHKAAIRRSPEFCQMLIELKIDHVKMKNVLGWLPFHLSCRCRKVDTAKYLFGLYPESIDIPNNNGSYPLHSFLRDPTPIHSEQDGIELVRFLLRNDRGAISAADQSAGNLPLHIACSGNVGINIIKHIYDAYPEAIHVQNNRVQTALDYARSHAKPEVVEFLETQFRYEQQAKEQLVSDRNRQLPVHRAVLDRNVSIGTIKLMLAANPNSITAGDNQGSTPLHLACQVGDIDKAKYLVDVYESALQMYNSHGECPLQIACHHGRCDIINYILEKSDHGLSVRNAEKRLPIQVILFDADCDRDSLEFVEAVGRLLFAYPVNPADLIKEDEIEED